MAGRSPSGWFYVLAVLVMFGGCGVSAWQGYQAFPDLQERVAAFPRLPVPGERELDLKADDYTLYAENKEPADESYPDVSDIACTVKGSAGPVAVRTAGLTERYTVNGLQAQAIARLTVPAKGRYQVACTGGKLPSVVSFGDISAHSLVIDLGTPVIAGWGLGLIMLIAVFIMRRR